MRPNMDLELEIKSDSYILYSLIIEVYNVSIVLQQSMKTYR